VVSPVDGGVTLSAEEYLFQQIQILQRITIDNAARMPPQLLLEHAVQYIRVHYALERMATSRSRSSRVHARVLKKHRRLDSKVRQFLLHRLITALESQQLTLEDGVELLASGQWPEQLSQTLSHLRAIVSARLSHALYHTQQQQKSGVTVSADDRDVITPTKARWFLKKLALSFVKRADIIGPLATIAWQDFNELESAEQIIASMWAIHQARTHAPDQVWRKAVHRLAQIRRLHGATAVHRLAQIRRLHGATALNASMIYRALRVCKRESWSGDVSTLSFLTSEALRDIVTNFSAEVAHQGAIAKAFPATCHTGLTPKRFVSLLAIAGELGHTFQAGFDAMSEGIIAPAIRSLKGEGEAAVACEMLRLTSSHSVAAHQAVIDLLVRINRIDPNLPSVGSTGVDDEPSEVVPVPIATTTSARHRIRAESIPSIELAARMVVRTPHFVQTLHLGPFIRLLLAVSKEKRKFSPTLMFSLTENMFQIHRQLKSSSQMGVELRKAVDEFSFQMDRLLQHGLVSVNLVNRFLEFSVMLALTKEPEVYTNTAALRETRRQLYEQYQKEGKEFSGVIVSHPMRRLVIDPYQLLFQTSVQLNFSRNRLSRAMLNSIRALSFESGVFASLEAARLYQQLHYERAGSPSLPTVLIPEVVSRQIIAACSHRAQTCGLGDHAALAAGITNEQLVKRLTLALRIPEGCLLDEAVVEMVIRSAAFSPFKPLIQAHPSLKLFFEALVSCDAATPSQRDRVKQLFSRTPLMQPHVSAIRMSIGAQQQNASVSVDDSANTQAKTDEDAEYQPAASDVGIKHHQ
ncbi:Hypothetical protein, putative, partial [Bodo saltans]